jgi:hypothetical protein
MAWPAAAFAAMVTLTGRVEYMNQSNLEQQRYPRIVVSPGVRSVAPEIVDPARMVSIRNAHRPGQTPPSVPAGSYAGGHTKTYFYLRFASFSSQWRRETRGSTEYRIFTGGTVFMTVALKIYVEEFRGPPPAGTDPRWIPTRNAIFALVMEHEYHHVADEITIVNSELASRIRQNPTVERYLVQCNPVPPDVFRTTFAGYATPRTITENVWFSGATPTGRDLEENMLNLYTVRHNRKTVERDGPNGEAARYQARIGELYRNLTQPGRQPWQGGPGDDPWQDPRPSR